MTYPLDVKIQDDEVEFRKVAKMVQRTGMSSFPGHRENEVAKFAQMHKAHQKLLVDEFENQKNNPGIINPPRNVLDVMEELPVLPKFHVTKDVLLQNLGSLSKETQRFTRALNNNQYRFTSNVSK